MASFVPDSSPHLPHLFQSRPPPRFQLLMPILQHSWYVCRFMFPVSSYLFINLSILVSGWMAYPILAISISVYLSPVRPSYTITFLCLVDYHRVFESLDLLISIFLSKSSFSSVFHLRLVPSLFLSLLDRPCLAWSKESRRCSP